MNTKLSISMLSLALAGAFGCDWVDYAFMNSLPVQGTGGASGEDFYVYLGVDGLAFSTLEDAQAQGAFADSAAGWRFARLATIFPGTSDASWTRIMHTEKLDGYELEYFDPHLDSLVNGGLLGGARHVLPSVSESLSFEAKYLDAFDYHANGYTHSIAAYSDVWTSAGETLDNLFFMLEGRIETGRTFAAYLLEIDLLGHLGSREDCAKLLVVLERRMEEFRRAHPSRKIHFTLFSDHGMDFTQIPRNRFVDMRVELPKVGVDAVEHLGGRDPKAEVYAVPVIHTRVTYVALHTDPALTEEVALRSSRLESVDFAAGSLGRPPEGESGDGRRWYGLWSEGHLSLWFAYVPSAHAYYIPPKGDLSRFGLSAGGTITDEDLFEATKHSLYPDLLYRVRTALEPVGVVHPAEVLLSFRRGYCSIGFRLPDPIDIFGPGYHGLAQDVATFGALITDERDLPEVVRADSLMSMFPELEKHVVGRGLALVENDADATRPLR